MPPSKPKPSEIAAEAKKNYIPYIRDNFSDRWPPTSYLCFSDSLHAKPPPRWESGERMNELMYHARFGIMTFYERDPVDLAIEWAAGESPIPVIMPAHDKRPGGDWEAGVMSPEECLCRRSNLFATLTTPAVGNSASCNYPIPSKAGIISQNVVVFRNGPEKYEPWQEYQTLPVISVAPVKRPKLKDNDKKYCFKDEKELMRDKLQTALRIAVYYGYVNLCIGTFGLGSGFGNPPEEVARMWRDLFLKDPEFVGHFNDVVFAFEPPEGPGGASSSSHSSSRSSSSKHSSKHSSSSSSSSSPKSSVTSNLEVFKHVFSPSVIHDDYKGSKHSKW